jgi:hypothetical protein
MPFDGFTTEVLTLSPYQILLPEPSHRSRTPQVPIENLLSMREICNLVLEAHGKGVLQATARVAGRYRRVACMEHTAVSPRGWLEASLWRLHLATPAPTTFFCVAGYVQARSDRVRDRFTSPDLVAAFTEDPQNFMSMVSCHDTIVRCQIDEARGLLQEFVASVSSVASGEAPRFAVLD